MDTPARSCLRRVPSRRMHDQPGARHACTRALCGLLVVAIFLAPGLVRWQLVFLLPVVMATGILIARRQAAAIAATREGESICTFVRSFPRRTSDTWVLRAAYEGLARVGFPIRADDRLTEDAWCDEEELSFVVPKIAAKAGRSLDGHEQNPVFARLVTVRDLVGFLQHQPRLTAAA